MFSVLHSTMLLLILYTRIDEGHAGTLLHSTMLLLILMHLRRLRSTSSFTFHYASTYTKLSSNSNQGGAIFTFHYASTYTNIKQQLYDYIAGFTFHYASTYTRTQG